MLVPDASACQVSAVPNCSHALSQDDNGMIIGAQVKDNLSGKKTNVYAKQVINATGPFTDGLRQMSDSSKPSIIMPSAGKPPHPHLNTSMHCTSILCFIKVSGSPYFSSLLMGKQ